MRVIRFLCAPASHLEREMMTALTLWGDWEHCLSEHTQSHENGDWRLGNVQESELFLHYQVEAACRELGPAWRGVSQRWRPAAFS